MRPRMPSSVRARCRAADRRARLLRPRSSRSPPSRLRRRRLGRRLALPAVTVVLARIVLAERVACAGSASCWRSAGVVAISRLTPRSSSSSETSAASRRRRRGGSQCPCRARAPAGLPKSSTNTQVGGGPPIGRPRARRSPGQACGRLDPRDHPRRTAARAASRRSGPRPRSSESIAVRTPARRAAARPRSSPRRGSCGRTMRSIRPSGATPISAENAASNSGSAALPVLQALEQLAGAEIARSGRGPCPGQGPRPRRRRGTTRTRRSSSPRRSRRSGRARGGPC